jgi:Asp-tRNA(Asn)/Glu-tRNA(Gln) amidotransferase A subunit family amidase
VSDLLAGVRRYDSVLEAVVTYTTDLAMEQALAADKLLAAGIYLGPLHGIPYGLKDIIAVGGYPTTWGAPQFRNQYISENANVYQR